MRALLLLLAALLFWTLGANSAAAQTPLDCAAIPQNICEDGEILALEGERSALVDHLTTLDPQSPVLAGEQTWLGALGACGEDAECYRTAYLNHNQMLRQSIAALPGAAAPEAETPTEAPPDTASIEEAPPAREDAAPARTRTRRETPERSGDGAYVPAGLPGWGFFTAFGVALAIFWALLRALRRNRAELRAQEAQLHEGWE